MRKLILNYVRSAGTHPFIKCDCTVMLIMLSHNSSSICDLFIGVLSSDYTALNGKMINEQGIGKDMTSVITAYFKVLC
jgi:hypothetical protein